MATVEVEARISNLEIEVKLLKDKLEKIETAEKPWWAKIAGTFADSEIYDEAMELGRQYRESQREDYEPDETNE